MSAKGFRFDRYTLDLARATLRRGEDDIELRPKSFDVLRYLVENASRVVSKDEIFAAVWPNVIVTDDSLVQCIRDIRLALADDAQQLVKTIPRRGYRFDAAVAPIDAQAAIGVTGAVAAVDKPLPPATDAAARRLPKRSVVLAAGALLLLVGALLSAWPLGWYRHSEPVSGGPPAVAVLFFAAGPAESGERSHDYFSDGLTDDVIAALGRFSGLRVLSRHALTPYRGTAFEPQQLRRDLNVRYVVDGSVRRSGDRLRVSARLTDAEQRLLWSESYDEELKDVFAVQDRVARSIVGRLAVRITRIEQERAAAKPTSSMEAYDYVLRAREKLARITRADNLEARRLLQTAAELDPRYAAAFVGLGHSYQNDFVYGWAQRPDEALRRAYEFAHRAIVLDENDPAGHLLLANAYIGNKLYGLALASADRGIELNPNDAEGHAVRGIMLVWIGRVDEAIAAFETAARFDPNHSRPRTLAHVGLAYFLAGRYDDAARAFEQSIGRNPEFILGPVGLAATYGELGKRTEAEHAANMVRRLDPFFTSVGFGTLFVEDAHRLRMIASLQKAGL